MAIDKQTLQAALIGYQSEQERITKAITHLQAQLTGGRASATDHAVGAAKPKRKMSAAARKRIAAAQKKRWTEYHNKHKT